MVSNSLPASQPEDHASNDGIFRSAVDVMKHAGHELCEASKIKWWRGEYTANEEQIQLNCRRWDAIKDEITKICSDLKRVKRQ